MLSTAKNMVVFAPLFRPSRAFLADYKYHYVEYRTRGGKSVLRNI
jgi:hypothetical protein